jgi:hypothetical protein
LPLLARSAGSAFATASSAPAATTPSATVRTPGARLVLAFAGLTAIGGFAAGVSVPVGFKSGRRIALGGGLLQRARGLGRFFFGDDGVDGHGEG